MEKLDAATAGSLAMLYSNDKGLPLEQILEVIRENAVNGKYEILVQTRELGQHVRYELEIMGYDVSAHKDDFNMAKISWWGAADDSDLIDAEKIRRYKERGCLCSRCVDNSDKPYTMQQIIERMLEAGKHGKDHYYVPESRLLDDIRDGLINRGFRIESALNKDLPFSELFGAFAERSDNPMIFFKISW